MSLWNSNVEILSLEMKSSMKWWGHIYSHTNFQNENNVSNFWIYNQMVRGYGRHYRKEREGGNNINNSTRKLSKNQQIGGVWKFLCDIFTYYLVLHVKKLNSRGLMKIQNDPELKWLYRTDDLIWSCWYQKMTTLFML